MILKFKGYYTNVENVPQEQGVYIIYAEHFNNNVKKHIREAVYIGQSDDIQRRIREHCREEPFQELHENGYTLLCSCVEITDADIIDSVENALICSRKPYLNTQSVDEYNHDSISIVATGKCLDLVNHFHTKDEPFTIITMPDR